MQSFLARHASKIKGVLSGFDRIRFRGTLRWLANTKGMLNWLWHRKMLLKEFKPLALSLTEQVRRQSEQIAKEADCPMPYLNSSSVSKEEQAQRIARSRGIREGLVCVFRCVEPCRTFEVGPNRRQKKLELRSFWGKCLHHYFYYIHPEWGWMHMRLQTWLPFTIHVGINGRDWLAMQLRGAGIPFVQKENCFVDVGDLTRAQELLNNQLQTRWEEPLNDLRRLFHSSHERIFGADLPDYYWSAEETEWATDVLFRSGADLAGIYPKLVHHGITTFGSGDVLRFFGRRPSVQHFHAAEISSNLKTRSEGVRIKHHFGHNSIKMYDKQGSVLRIETTINDARAIRQYRASETDPEGPKRWRNMRKGVDALPRRAEFCQGANARYLEALSTVEHDLPLKKTVGALSGPTTWKGRRVRALNPLGLEDGRLLLAISRGEFTVHGFRNQDLRPLLFDRPAARTTVEGRRQSAKVTRQLRLLRGHKLIKKITGTHRYHLTKSGRVQITAILTAQNASTAKLTELAA
jgi:hypothetical protein